MNPKRISELAELMTKLNYSFTDVELLNTALTHSSFVRGDNRIYPNNERMEFLKLWKNQKVYSLLCLEEKKVKDIMI